MIREKFLFAWVLVLAAFPLAGTAQIISEQKKTVGFLFGTLHPRVADGVPLQNDSGKQVAIEAPLGTAFFAFYPDSRVGPDSGFMYLVTAKHVLRDTDGRFLKEVKLRLNLQESANDQSGRHFDFIEKIPVSDPSGRLLWLYDTSDEATDIALFPLLPSMKRFDFKAVSIEMFVTDDLLKKEKVAEGDSLFFVGLMSQFYGESRNFPVVRHGTLAMITNEQISTPTGRQNAFIAELASWPGNSGSPVFLNLGGMREGSLNLGINSKFLGILSGSFLNKTEATTVEAGTLIGGNELNTGISFIIPAEQVKKILLSAPAEQRRQKELKRLQTTP